MSLGLTTAISLEARCQGCDPTGGQVGAAGWRHPSAAPKSAAGGVSTWVLPLGSLPNHQTSSSA